MAAAAAAAGEGGRCSVYFCGSIRGGREDQALYARIVSRLRRYGKVLTEHVAAAELDPRGQMPLQHPGEELAMPVTAH